MSINPFTNYKDFIYSKTNATISTQDAQKIQSIAKSLEASALEFESRKRKIVESKREGREQSAKRARIQNAITTLQNTNRVSLSDPPSQYAFPALLPDFERELANNEVKDNKEFALKIIQNFGENLEFVSERLKNDKEVVLSAVQNTGYALKFASDTLKDDEEVVITALKRFGLALGFASERLKNNKNFLISCTKCSEFTLQFAGKELQNDKELVLMAVQNSGNALQYASEKLKDDEEVVFTAFKNYVYSLEFASHRLRNNKKFMLNAIRSSAGLALPFASEELKNDPEIMEATSPYLSFFGTASTALHILVD